MMSNQQVIRIGSFQNKPARSKASHTKTRTGCARCKKRRIKCDETRPECTRCVRAGEPCPGYPEIQMKLFGLSLDSGFDSELDKKCFDSFTFHGAHQIAVFQPCSVPFWTIVLPQLSQLHLSLRHSVIALSLINEPLSNNSVARIAQNYRPDLLKSILSHYNAAIRGFTSNVDSMTIEAKLASCLVFVALTIYLDRTTASTSHTLAAFHFIQEHEERVRRGEVVRDRAITDQFLPVMKKLLVDACVFQDAAPQLGRYQINPIMDWVEEYLAVPTLFATFEDAWDCIANLLKCAVASTQNIMPVTTVEKLRLQQALKNFADVVKSSDINILGGKQLTPAQINTHFKALLLHHRTITVLSQCGSDMKECDYELYQGEFQMIFCQAVDVLTTEFFETWRIGLGFLPPLFFVATRCRSSLLRHQALDLLHQTGRMERCWTSCMAYTLAKFVVDLEDASSHACQTNPSLSQNYIRLEKVDLDPTGQTATIEFINQADGRDSAPVRFRIPCPVDIGLTQTAVDDLMSASVLKASGYSGILLCTGAIPCACSTDVALKTYPVLHEKPTVADYPWLRKQLEPLPFRRDSQESDYTSISGTDEADIIPPKTTT